MTNPTRRIIGAKLAEAERGVNHGAVIGFNLMKSFTVPMECSMTNYALPADSIRIGEHNFVARRRERRMGASELDFSEVIPKRKQFKNPAVLLDQSLHFWTYPSNQIENLLVVFLQVSSEDRLVVGDPIAQVS